MYKTAAKGGRKELAKGKEESQTGFSIIGHILPAFTSDDNLGKPLSPLFMKPIRSTLP